MDVTAFPTHKFCWHEVGTTDDAKIKPFYEGLFHWNLEPSDLVHDAEADATVEGGMQYWMIRQNGKDIGGAYKMMPQMLEQGVPPHWLCYVGVDSVDETTERVTELGGNVVMPGMDVFDLGRMAMIADPTGAHFALWQPGKHTGHGLCGEAGAVCWNELMTSDVEKATSFYASLFGWTPEVQNMGTFDYTTMMLGEEPVAGLMALPPEAGPMPPSWMVYFQVGDTDEQVARAQSLGGSLAGQVLDIPTVGRMATLADPTGAHFSVIRLADNPAG